MDFRELQIVVAIADEGSATRAGVVLHQSPSTLSYRLQNLEHELGVDLFHRLPRGMRLTDVGKAFVVAARRVLHEAEAARAAVDDARGLVSGQLTLVALPTLTRPLADLIGSYRARYCGVLVRVLPPATESDIAELVRCGGCDLGIARPGPLIADLDGTIIGTETFVVVVPAGHHLAARSAVTVRDLADEPLVAPLSSSPGRRFFDELFRLHNTNANVVAESATNEMAVELVRAGVACTITSSMSVQIGAEGTAVLECIGHPSADVLLLSRKGQRLTPAANAFRDLARID